MFLVNLCHTSPDKKSGTKRQDALSLPFFFSSVSSAVAEHVSDKADHTPAAARTVMTYLAKKCGICFQPPSIILIYKEDSKDKTRQRIMPVRNFSKFSGECIYL